MSYNNGFNNHNISWIRNTGELLFIIGSYKVGRKKAMSKPMMLCAYK